MSRKYDPISVELRALIVLLVLSIQIILALRAGLALVDLLILDMALVPLVFLRRKACCKDRDRGGVV